MALTRLAVRNFRGLREARLEFGEIALWIGENGAGKSSLFEALALALEPAPEGMFAAFRAADFHRPHGGKGGPIRITVELIEPAPGRWRCLDAPALQPVMRSDTDGVRRVSLRLHARRDRSGRIHTRAEALDWDAADQSVALDEALVADLREASPIVVLRGGQLVTRVRSSPGGRRGTDPDAIRGRLETFHRRLAGGGHAPPEAGMREGLLAAFELAQRIGHSTDLARASPTALIVAMAQALHVNGGPPVGCNGGQDGGEEPLPLAQHGGGAVLVGVLFLLGALIGVADDASGTSPIILMEQPEAGLHPILLAAVWRLIEGMSMQRVVATESGVLLSSAPLTALRRLYRRDGSLQVRHLQADSLEPDELRKVSYHVRARRGDALFARCWLLVEGESEFWYLPEFSAALGFDLAAEGVACVEFAQCGIRPLVRLADALGIEWHVLCDGDNAGNSYRGVAEALLDGRPLARHISQLREPDIEHCLWNAGYDKLIELPLRRGSKPALAMAVLDAARQADRPGVPPVLAGAIRASVEMARSQGPVMASFA
jgi:putative ATP-dependent endonuclease of the OLD family